MPYDLINFTTNQHKLAEVVKRQESTFWYFSSNNLSTFFVAIYVFDFLIPTVGSSSETPMKMSPFKVLLLLFAVFEKAVNGSGGILWERRTRLFTRGTSGISRA